MIYILYEICFLTKVLLTFETLWKVKISSNNVIGHEALIFIITFSEVIAVYP